MKLSSLFFARSILTAGLLFFILTGHAQLSGIKNIPGDYPTLAAAVTDLNSQGVGPGGVVFNMNAGETAPAGGYDITATGTFPDQVVFNGNGNVITASAAQTPGSLNDAIFKITGADFITISAFTMQENAANTDMTPGTNTMTEWGVALLYMSATNGAKSNNIGGNVISLNRNYSNSFGIYSNTRHTAGSVSVAADITAASGTNSGNRIYGNSISNVNMGIAFIGSNDPALMDTNNDVGGGMAITGNVITNWGGAAAASGYVSNSATSYGILMNHQKAYNVSNNQLTSAAVAPSVSFRGIAQEYTAANPSGLFTNTISANTITMTSAQTSATFRAIETAGGAAGMALNISANIILNSSITSASSILFGGIFNSGGVDYLYINDNIFQGNASASTSGGFTAISNSGAVISSIVINSNEIGTPSGPAITFSSGISGALTGIVNSSGAAGSSLTINGNDIRGITNVVLSSLTQNYINNTSPNPNTTINNNSFTNLVANTTGSVTFIGNNVTHAANTIHNVNENFIAGSFSKTGAGGTVYFYNAFGSSPNTVTETNTGNNFSNMTFTGATTVIGWRSGDGSTTAPYGSNKTVTNNIFTNITGGTSAVQMLQVDYSNSASANNNVSGNIISNVTAAGTVTGILSGQGSQNFFDNSISSLTTTGTGATSVFGISITNGVAQTIYRNKLYNFQADGATGNISAIRVFGGTATTTTTIYNNLIGDLRAPASGNINALNGINVTATAAGEMINAYYNTIYLNGSSTGTNFGSSGINVNTGPTVELKNNLVVNLSTATGTGLTVAHRRTSATLTTYSNASDNNSFYAGTPSATNLIFYDGTNSDQTLGAYKTRVAPRDAASVTDNPPFISTTGSSSGFLHIPAATATPLESGGATIAGITDDYDGDVRPGPAGSVNGGALAPDIGADEFDGMLTCMGTPVAGTASISPTSAACGSGTFTLTLTGASTDTGVTYQWREAAVSGGPYTNIAGATGTTYTVTVTNTMYFVAVVTCTYSDQSITSNEVTATINPNPTVLATATNTTICSGDSTQLTASGADTYNWMPGNLSGDSVMVSPASSTTYTVTGTDANSCTNTATITITVNTLPVVTANATATTVCSGDSVTLSGSGADSYTWSGGVTDGVSFTPSSTDTYTVTGTDANGCMDTDAITITVNPLPLVVANATSSAVCDGDSVTLTGSGAVSYTWSGGVMDGMPFAPSSTDTYTVTGTDGTGCMNTDNITIIVNPLPLVVANATSSAVCDGDSVTLTGSGAVSYTWSGGVMDGVSFTPAATDTYTVTGTDANGCMNTDAITITVNPLPAVVAGASSTSICSGDLVTLTGSGAANYFWTGGVTDGVPFAPPVTTTYTVTGIDTNGCSNSDAVTIIVNPQPVIVATASDSTVCEGDAVTLTGSGGIFYSWSNGAMNGFPFSIFTSQTFTVTGTDANGCQGIDSVAIAVNNAPSVSLALPIDTACLLGGVITLSGETPPGGTWSGPGVSGNTFDPFIAGNGMWGIDYMFTDSIGCSSTATDSILVDPCTDIPSASSPGETVIYPNPTTGQFFIQLEMNLSSKVSVLVMNELGQTIQSFTMTETRREVDLANYAAGVYFVRIINDTQVNIYRVVKQ